MSDFIEICPQCGKVYWEPCQKCDQCNSTFDLTEVNARRQEWLKFRKKDGFVSAAVKIVAEADFTNIDSNLVQAVFLCADFEALKKVVAAGYDHWDSPDLLMAAIRAPLPEMMAFLKQANVDLKHFFADLTAGKYYMLGEVSAAPKKVDTPTASKRLRNAVEAGSIKKVEFWLQNGADVNFCPYSEADINAAKGIWYIHTLPIISFARSLKIAELLVANGAKLNDWRILSYATQYSNLAVVRCLVENGAKYFTDKVECNLLCDAAFNGDLKLFKYLHGLGFDLNKGINDRGENPLRIAADWAHGEILRYLLENGAKTNIGDSKFGSFVDQIRMEEEDKALKCLQVLVDFNISICRCGLLKSAAWHGLIKVAEFLLNHGCPMEEYTVDGKIRTFPLHSCVWGGGENKSEMIDFLLSRGASINGIEMYCGSPLRMAIRNVEPEVVEKLLQCGADANLDEKDKRPLLVEALYQKPATKVLKMVKLLVEYGANTKVTYGQKTPMQIAQQYGHSKVVEYFKSLGIKR